MISRIAIGIVTFERGELTRKCINSIRACAGHDYHIFLVDNASKTEAAKEVLNWCRQNDDISVRIESRNHGASYARNLILEMAAGKFPVFAMLDNDIIALPGWDVAALKAIDNGADLIQPKLLRGDGRTVERGPTQPRSNPFSANPEYCGVGLNTGEPLVNIRGDAAIVGGTGIVRREVYEKIGGYDERMDIGEDFDYSYRAREAGFSLRYEPMCALIHDHGFDLDYDLERGNIKKYLHSHVFFWRKHRKALLSPQYLAWYGWLYFHNEPMYMPTAAKWKTAPRRIKRRVARLACMNRKRHEWRSYAEADEATERLAARLGI